MHSSSSPRVNKFHLMINTLLLDIYLSQISKYFSHLFDMGYSKHVNVSIIENTSRGRLESRKCLVTEEQSWLDAKDQA